MKYFDLLPNRRIRIGRGNKTKIINVDGFLVISAALVSAIGVMLTPFISGLLCIALGGTI